MSGTRSTILFVAVANLIASIAIPLYIGVCVGVFHATAFSRWRELQTDKIATIDVQAATQSSSSSVNSSISIRNGDISDFLLDGDEQFYTSACWVGVFCAMTAITLFVCVWSTRKNLDNSRTKTA